MASSLWSELLSSTKKGGNSQSQGTIVFIGDVHSGKTRLVEKLCSAEAVPRTATGEESNSSSGSRLEIMGYNYFNVDEGSVESESVLRVNVWSVNNAAFENAFEVVYGRAGEAHEGADRLLFMIGVDLSLGAEANVKSLRQWLHRVKGYSQHYYSFLGPALTAKATAAQAQYLRTARINKGTAVNEEATGSKLVSIESALFGCPVVVVGLKADCVASDSLSALKRSQEQQGQLRSLCLQAGAALVYTSVRSGKDTNVKRLRRYLTHRLYPETIGTELSLEDGVDEVFVPAGFDSSELVAALYEQQGAGAGVGLELSAEEVAEMTASAPLSHSVTVAAAASGASGDIAEQESEQDWLAGLQGYVMQVTNAATVAAPAAPALASSSSATALSALSGAGAGTGAGAVAGENGVVAEAAVSAAAPKRPTRATASTTQQKKEDVDDFFKSLLSSNKK